MSPVSTRPPAQHLVTEVVELVVAPTAIERALHLYEQPQAHDTSVVLQARKILTQHISEWWTRANWTRKSSSRAASLN
jgi:hypothetical protein